MTAILKMGEKTIFDSWPLIVYDVWTS